MAKRTRIKDIFTVATSRQYTVMGWVRTFRNNQFIALNDGSCLANLQVVVDFENWDAALLKRITTGAALHIRRKADSFSGQGADSGVGS
jgi:asparaginyl-tRNA synthetase